MSSQHSPETERLVEQGIASGRFHSVDEIIRQGVRTLDSEEERWRKHREAIESIRDFALHKARPLNGITIKELIEEGRL